LITYDQIKEEEMIGSCCSHWKGEKLEWKRQNREAKA